MPAPDLLTVPLFVRVDDALMKALERKRMREEKAGAGRRVSKADIVRVALWQYIRAEQPGT